jgi:3',5'-cyclic AMP phosphodiesterase CpdA
MTMPALLRFAVLGVLAFSASAQPIRVDRSPDVNPWNHLNFNEDPARFQFAVVADRTGGNRQEVFQEAVYKLNLVQPDFVMSVGDLQEGYTSDPRLITSFWRTFTSFVEQLEMPFFYVPGNHDLASPALREEWKRRFGRNYYHFVYKEVLFLCLDSEDRPGGAVGPEQRAYFRRVLAENRSVRWTFVFLHRPLWTYTGDTGWAEMDALLEDRAYTIFAGHNHRYFKIDRRGREHFILATTGGGSRLRGPGYGEFDHLVWVTMTSEGPRYANLMLDGIWDQNIRTISSDAQFLGFVEGTAVKLEPVISTAPAFTSGAARLVIRNDAYYPMNFQAFFEPHEALRSSPDRLHLVLPPRSDRTVDIQVASERPVRLEDLAPQRFHWNAQYRLPSQPPAGFEGRSALFIERAAYDCTRPSAPVVVDGRLDEWRELPFAVREPVELSRLADNKWMGPGDLQFRFATACDEEHLYLAIDVRDDALVLDENLKHWEQDGLEVWLDPNPGPNSRREAVLYLGISPSGYVNERDRLPKDVRIASIQTETGHTTEIAVPYAGGSWKQFRLNVGAIDRDPNEWALRIRWRPEWGAPADFPASGMFRRQGGR